MTIRPSYGYNLGRLFCLPFAGGGAAAYHSWQDSIPLEIELARVHLPGREARLREELFVRLKPLVKTLANQLISCFDRPFALFGHSMGALVAFELARELRRQYDLLPVHLFVSGHRAPHLPDLNTPIRNLCDLDFVENIKQYNGTPELVFKNQELLDIFLPILRADFTIIETYQFISEPPLDCPITAFGGLGDPRNNRLEIEAWKDHTKNSFTSHYFIGGHFFINQNQRELLKIVINKMTDSLLKTTR